MAKILIVDDSQLSRRILRGILETAGHAVIEESDGLTALERYALEQPAFVFLDMTMKGLHGLEVLTQIRQLNPNAKVVIGSADIQSSTKETSRVGGACAFIEKPFTSEKVLAALAEALKA